MPFSTRFPNKSTSLLAAVLVCALAAGCGRGHPQTHPVSGKITYRGRPVAEGTIMFYPGEGRSAMSNIESDGSYRLTTFRAGDGALPGRHTVTITAIAEGSAGPATMEEEMQHGMLGRGEEGIQWLVPEHYSRRDTSPLTAEVPTPNGKLNFDIAE